MQSKLQNDKTWIVESMEYGAYFSTSRYDNKTTKMQTEPQNGKNIKMNMERTSER